MLKIFLKVYVCLLCVKVHWLLTSYLSCKMSNLKMIKWRIPSIFKGTIPSYAGISRFQTSSTIFDCGKTPLDSHAANTSGYPAGPPPYSGYPPGPPGPPPPVHITTVVPGAVIIHQSVGPDPTHSVCRSCNQQMVTRVERKASMRTHLCAAILCLFLCWPCACVPYCMDSCLNTDHYCTNCGAFVGTYIR